MMKSETSRVATLVGLLGLILGAVLGATIDNFLERGRNFEKSVYDKQVEAISGMMLSRESGPNREINIGRKLLALTADKETVLAIRKWMAWEKRAEKDHKMRRFRGEEMEPCLGSEDAEDPSYRKNLEELMAIYLKLRQSFRGEGRGWFDWMPIHEDDVRAHTLWEVYNRCLFATAE